MNVLAVYYSLYGTLHCMAEAVAEGAREIKGAHVAIRCVPETPPSNALKKMGAVEAQQRMANVPICEVHELAHADACGWEKLPRAWKALIGGDFRSI